MDLSFDEFKIARDYLKSRCEEYSLRIDNGESDWLDDVQAEHQSLSEKLEYPLKLLTEELDGTLRNHGLLDCDEVKRLRNYRDTLVNRMKSLEQKKSSIGKQDRCLLIMEQLVCLICAKGKTEGQLIYLSGSGAGRNIQ